MLEIAIVLAVVALLMGMGIQTYSRSLDNAKRKTTTDRLDKIEEAITSFAIQYNYLPCPADGTFVSASAFYGLERNNGLTGCAAVTTAGAEVIPWRTLGLDELYSRDGWGNRISYVVGGLDSSVTTPISYTVGTTDGIQRNGTSYPRGNLEIQDIAGNELTYSNATAANCIVVPIPNFYTCAAYVLISHGANAVGAYSGSGAGAGPLAALGGTAGLSEPNNSDGTSPFVQNDPTERASTSGIFDDIVRWRSAQSIVASCGQGACGNPGGS